MGTVTFNYLAPAEQQKHISTCLPPLYRPPNAPPDLQSLISEAIGTASGKSGPVSLIDYHVKLTGEEAIDDRDDMSAQSILSNPIASKIKAKGKNKSTPATLKHTTVKSAEERGEGWESQVDEKMCTFLGYPSSPTYSDKMSTSSCPSLPPTQPLGDSELAGLYAQTDSRLFSPSPKKISASPKTPLSSPRDSHSPYNAEDEENSPMMPPSSQARRRQSSGESRRSISPFRTWGSSRVDGCFSDIKSTGGGVGQIRVEQSGPSP